MRLALKNSIALMVLLLSLGFAKDGIIELEGYLNGRSSANFLKQTKNVKFVLPPGTQAKIQETKKFNSGNYGLKVEVTSGPRKGESVWVYYRTSDPGMKIFENEEAEKKEQEVKDVEKASLAKTTREHEVIREPAAVQKKTAKEIKPEPQPENKRPAVKKLALEDAEETVHKVNEANTALQKHGQPGGPCAECDLEKTYATDAGPQEEKSTVFTAKPSQDPPLIIPPMRTQNPYGIRPTSCRTSPGDIDYCTFEGDSQPGKFKFRNRGPNKIVSAGDSARSREWEFKFEGNARQDLGFSISDMPNGTISHTQESYFMVFPRKTVPTVRTIGDRQVVTLPTGETVTFDVKSKQVIGGVMSEDGALTGGGKTLQPAKVAYHGNGVMVRVDARGDEPRLKAEMATITKQGKTCKVPAKKLWPDRSERSAVHFKYFSDTDFDSFLKSACGFGL